jgi:transcriptional regulator with XRE-family HTH domain
MHRAREASGLSQAEVCARLQIAQSSMSQLEGSSDGSTYTAQLAALYHVDPLWLATGDGPEPDWSTPWDQRQATCGPMVSAEEMTLLQTYRGLPRDLQSHAAMFLLSLAAHLNPPVADDPRDAIAAALHRLPPEDWDMAAHALTTASPETIYRLVRELESGDVDHVPASTARTQS